MKKNGFNITFSRKNVILGYTEKRNYVLNLIITATKFNIFKMKLKGIKPNFNNIKKDIETLYAIERSNLFTDCRHNYFMSFWSVCHNMFN